MVVRQKNSRHSRAVAGAEFGKKRPNGLLVLLTVETRATGRRAGRHHKLPDLFALAPAARLGRIIIRAIDHFHAPQGALVRLGVDKIGRSELSLGGDADISLAHFAIPPWRTRRSVVVP